jgi:putative FmdB family regulatory protein
MPLYEYYCEKCQKVFDRLQNMSDTSEVRCPQCNEVTKHKLVSQANFNLKGQGWPSKDLKGK